MNRFSILAAITVSLLSLGVALPANDAAGQEKAQHAPSRHRLHKYN
jgi:hypothetical protein